MKNLLKIRFWRKQAAGFDEKLQKVKKQKAAKKGTFYSEKGKKQEQHVNKINSFYCCVHLL